MISVGVSGHRTCHRIPVYPNALDQKQITQLVKDNPTNHKLHEIRHTDRRSGTVTGSYSNKNNQNRLNLSQSTYYKADVLFHCLY